VHAQLGQTFSQRQAVAPSDHHGVHACRLKCFQTMAIKGVKPFECFAIVADKQTAIGQHPIDIQKKHLDLACARKQLRLESVCV
jgi:hypothetical protein